MVNHHSLVQLRALSDRLLRKKPTVALRCAFGHLTGTLNNLYTFFGMWQLLFVHNDEFLLWHIR